MNLDGVKYCLMGDIKMNGLYGIRMHREYAKFIDTEDTTPHLTQSLPISVMKTY